MSKVALQGNASGTGTFTIAAPNSNTDRTLTLPDEAGTVLTSASSLAAANLTGSLPALDGSALTNVGYTLAAAQSASGSSITFSGIPSGVKRIIVSVHEVSHNSGSNEFVLLRLGTSGGIVSSGYVSWCKNMGGGSFTTYGAQTTAMYCGPYTSAANAAYGQAFLSRVSSNVWVQNGIIGEANDTTAVVFSKVSLSGELTQIQLLPSNGSFDGGSISIMYM